MWRRLLDQHPSTLDLSTAIVYTWKRLTSRNTSKIFTTTVGSGATR